MGPRIYVLVQRGCSKTSKADVFSTGLLSVSVSVGAAGFERATGTPSDANCLENKAIEEPCAEPKANLDEAKLLNAGARTIDANTVDAIELALAAALDGATKAGEWSTVARIAGELEARRLARSEVVDLSVERKRRQS